MSRPNPLLLLAALAAFLVAISAASLTKGGLYVARHEGDMLHLLEILLRLDRGEIPHLDFMTPIGAFAFLPIHWFVGADYGIDQAVLWAQSAIAAALLPMIWWTAWTRFSGVAAYGFGLVCLVLVLALVHGQTIDAVSLSMHYNRWAWALAYLAVALAVLVPRGRAIPVIDGAIIGFCVGCLAMIKVTYVVGLAPVLIAALIMRQDLKALVSALAAGLIVAVAVTVWAGVSFWLAYLNDILTVAGSEIRPNPSLDFAGTLVTPAYVGGSLASLAAVIMLRRAGAEQGGLLVFLALPGFAYITYQNFGNDPQWLALLGLLVLMLLDEADVEAAKPVRRLGYVVAIIFAFASPSLFNLAYSPIRHAQVDTELYAPFLPKSDQHGGFQTTNIRANRIDGAIPLDGPQSRLEAYGAVIERADPAVFQGETLPQCEVIIGLPGWMDGLAQDLSSAGFADGTQVFVADIFSSQWMFNGQVPLENGSPWYYAGLPGLENADYLMVPLCPALPPVRKTLLDLLSESGYTFDEVYRSPLLILYSVS